MVACTTLSIYWHLALVEILNPRRSLVINWSLTSTSKLSGPRMYKYFGGEKRKASEWVSECANKWVRVIEPEYRARRRQFIFLLSPGTAEDASRSFNLLPPPPHNSTHLSPLIFFIYFLSSRDTQTHTHTHVIDTHAATSSHYFVAIVKI